MRGLRRRRTLSFRILNPLAKEHEMRTIAAFTVGALAATAFLFACGDDMPAGADASSHCDCPAAEPPLAGRIVRRAVSFDVGANEEKQVVQRCSDDETILSGSCSTLEPQGGGSINLRQSGFSSQGDPETTAVWVCTWENNDPNPNTVTATVVCLVPPS